MEGAVTAARTILTIEDHELVRMGLRTLIDRHFQETFKVEDAQNLEQALLYLKEHAHEVLLILLDLHLSDTRGLVGLQLLKRSYPHLPIVVVSGMQDPRVREEALGHGAIAYFCKTGNEGGTNGFLEIIEKVSSGCLGQLEQTSQNRTGCQPNLSGFGNEKVAVHSTDMKLSGRQVQVLELILSGQDNQAIAHETGLTLGSVKNCVSSIFLTFNVRSRAELIGLFAG
jgi:DNA-binding NarL/FixJ family response regulator